MQKEKIKPLSLLWITRAAILLGITLAFQMLGLPQMVTGPAVNGMLLLAGTYVGLLGAVIIGMLTPFIAFIRGILAPPLGPMIPFIMLGNALWVAMYILMRNLLGKGLRGCVAGIVLGALVKFLVLSTAVRLIVSVPPPVAQAMQVPQLITAVIGGIVAFIVEQALNSVARI